MKLKKEQKQLLIWSIQIAISDIKRENLLSGNPQAILQLEKQIREMEALIKKLKGQK